MHPEVPSLVSDIFCTIGMFSAVWNFYILIRIISMHDEVLIN